MPEEKLTTLKELIKIVANSVTRSEFADAFKKIADAVANAKKDLEARIDARLAQIKNGKDGKDGKSIVGPRGPMGPAGRSIFGGRGEPGPAGKDGSPDTPDEIVIKLESLEGEDRLDASAIKNLPKTIENHYGSTGIHGPLWALQDVDVSGIIAGQSIQWDGVNWVPYTPAGSGGTPVWGEVLEDQGAGTDFTLDHTPSTGTLRLFRGGAYQRVTDDYTLTGAVITLTTTLQTGETLTADYSYT